MFRGCYAIMYDRISAGSERAGLSEERRALLAQAARATIEVGAGTGLNLAHFPRAVSRLCLVEPDPDMRKRLRRRAEGREHVEIVDARAEALPFPDATFDTAVVTFALCSVGAPDTALAEIARVLRPGGRLLFLEHVRDADPANARNRTTRCSFTHGLAATPTATPWPRSAGRRSRSQQSGMARCRRPLGWNGP